ncbi:hypothetical protein BDN70DRAFT_998589 [Pholiota conissans]|uniref:NACHT domain-containing protein n=1 Tax=Pholiota conissans TaxID=109636 RepID=A0A9P6CRW6_9AGAR|nr:hypothetical protein BDN70DRAFT_998589 [Pholiota conissans]
MSDSSQQIFPNANSPAIHGGQFSNVQGDMHIHSATAERYGEYIAYAPNCNNIYVSALHDATERGDQPGCHENTRVAVLKEIMDWLQDPNARKEFIYWLQDPNACKKFVYWLYGPAGSGKTSIAQSIAEALAKLGLLAASFFFWRSAAGRNTSDHFVTTIAYQLSRSIPTMADPLYTAIEKDPIIFSKSLATQLKDLIVIPLKAALQCTTPHTLPKPVIIIIDGLDECSPAKSQVELLGLLRTTVEEFRSIPFLCLVSSRPEYDIRSTFADSNPLGALTTTLALDNDYQTDKDIKLFLVSKFNKIRDEHCRLGSRLPSPWPADHDVDYIVKKASGQFIFAATAMKFIDDPRGDPVERLSIILGLSKPGPGQMPFDSLDELYRTILASIAPDSLPKVLDILSLIILGPSLGFGPSHDFCLELHNDVIEDLLALDVPKTLIDMHALVHVPSVDSQYRVHLHHKSFEDFLLDKSRSREYYLETIQVYPRLTRHFIHALENFNTLKSCWDLQFFADIFDVIFSNLHIHLHPDETLAKGFASFNIQLALKHYGGEIQHSHRPWNSFLLCAKTQAELRADIFPRLWNKFCTVWLGRIPTQLHSFIPAIISFKEHASDMITILGFPYLNGDKTFAWPSGKDTDIPITLSNLLTREESQYHLDYIADYKALGRRIIEVIFPVLGQKRYVDLYEERLLDRMVFTLNLWYPELLSRIPMDLEFGKFLCRRSLQFFHLEHQIQYNIAKYSLEYVKKCGIRYLEHTHRPDLRGCIICNKHSDAIVLELDVLAQTEFDTLLLGMISNSVDDILCAPALSELNYTDHMALELISWTPYHWTHDRYMANVAFNALWRRATGDSSMDERTVRGLSRLALAKTLVDKLSLLSYQRDLLYTHHDFADITASVLPNCPLDLDLATFLRDHALQLEDESNFEFYPFTSPLRGLAEASLEYAQRCGIPFLEHTHPPSTIACIICVKTLDGASVVEAEQLPYVRTPMDSPKSWPIAPPQFLSAAKLFLEQLRTSRTGQDDLVEDVPEALAKRKHSDKDEQDEANGTTKKQRQSASSD